MPTGSKPRPLFRTRCVGCHTIGSEDERQANQKELGPDLLDVTQKRDRASLARWLAEPEKMLAEKDPIIMGLYAKYNNVTMPNMRLSAIEITALIDYLNAERVRIAKPQSHH